MGKTAAEGDKHARNFCWLMVALAVVSMAVDLWENDQTYLFARAGALLTIAGVNLQYVKLIQLWDTTLKGQITRPPVEERIASGSGVELGDAARQAEEAQNLARSLHGLVTEKSLKDVLAIRFIVFGTLIWAYGDLYIELARKVVRGHL